MELRPLGSTGLRTSVIGLGTVKLGRNTGVKYPSAFQLPDDAAAASLLRTAADLGINLIDTAPAYGESEQRLGALLAGWRDRWIITTKVGEEFADGASHFDFSAPACRASVERSLRRLRTEVLDCVLVHSDGQIETSFAGSPLHNELDSLKRQGKVRAFGVSTKTIEGAIHALPVCDVLMLTIAPGDGNADAPDAPAAEAAARRGVGVLVKKALRSGHAATPADVRRAFTYALGFRAVASIVVGTINPAHLRENCEAADAALRERLPAPLR